MSAVPAQLRDLSQAQRRQTDRRLQDTRPGRRWPLLQTRESRSLWARGSCVNSTPTATNRLPTRKIRVRHDRTCINQGAFGHVPGIRRLKPTSVDPALLIKAERSCSHHPCRRDHSRIRSLFRELGKTVAEAKPSAQPTLVLTPSVLSRSRCARKHRRTDRLAWPDGSERQPFAAQARQIVPYRDRDGEPSDRDQRQARSKSHSGKLTCRSLSFAGRVRRNLSQPNWWPKNLAEKDRPAQSAPTLQIRKRPVDGFRRHS